MRDIQELNEPITLTNRVGTTTNPVNCLEPYKTTTNLCTPPAGLKAAMRWVVYWRPAEYTCNLRPGLPLWLLWNMTRKGIYVRGIIARGQLDPVTELTDLYLTAWEVCDEQIEVATTEERDRLVASHGVSITIEHVLAGLPPD